MERKNHQDFITSLIVGALGAYCIGESIAATQKYYARPQHSDMLTSPGLMPMILGLALLLCAVMLCVRSVRGYGFSKLWTDIKTSTVALAKSKVVHFTLIGLLWMGIYIYLLLDLLPFAIASLIFLLGLLFMLKASKWWKNILIALLSVIFIVVLFQMVFHIRLP